MKVQFLIISILLFFSLGCSNIKHDNRLTSIADIVDDSPSSAIEALDSIDHTLLNTFDRHYYDFLSIKARDKAYITHTSDSLILDVIEYYADHQTEGLYAESLYYGGRVYSDMGDTPSAMHYFQSALDLLPPNTQNLKLRGSVLSQTGRLLNSLRLYEQATPYLESVIQLDSICNDTINLVYDLQLLAECYFRAENYGKAELIIHRALEKGTFLPQSFEAKSKVTLAGIKLREGKIDSALVLIRNTTKEVKSITRSGALTFAAQIYQAAGRIDTAYIYAREILQDEDQTHHGIGYQVLLSPEVRHFMPQDSIDQLITEYRAYLEGYFDSNESQQSINQQSFFNYQIHERERNKAEHKNELLYRWIIGIVLLVMLLVVALLLYRVRYKNKVIQLYIALERINALTEKLNVQSKEISVVNQDKLSWLRAQLRSKLIVIANSQAQLPIVDPAISMSEAFISLRKLIESGKIIKETDELWERLEKVVLDHSPNFVTDLQLLTKGNLTKVDLRTALLIRCGVSPTDMSLLLGRSKGTISSRRAALCYKVFDKNLGTKVIDSVIRLL
jgi:tetratricopeptide (TPR) repeat protein